MVSISLSRSPSLSVALLRSNASRECWKPRPRAFDLLMVSLQLKSFPILWNIIIIGAEPQLAVAICPACLPNKHFGRRTFSLDFSNS